MSNTKVNFYRGTQGMGVVISVTCDKDRIILDFGAPFTPLAEIYDGTVKPRYRNRVKDALLLERIPAVPGVFTREDLQDLSCQSYEESDLNTAVFISHLHLDHMSEADKIAPQIPVYIHENGLKLLDALCTVGREKTHRSFSPFRYHEKVEVGSIHVTPYFSDHPCPGSAGFLIETPDSTIYYSGDIRFHGLNSQKALKELDELSNLQTDLLIVDSTTTSPAEFTGELITEMGIYKDIAYLLNGFNGLGVFNQYDRDVDMMARMVQVGQRLGRITVFEPAYAYILNALYGYNAPILIPDLREYPQYIKEMANWPKVTVEEIKAHPDKYLLQNSYGNILTLTDFDGIAGKYFHLFGEPLVAGAKEYNIMLNVIKKLNWEFSSYTNLYSFSHAYPEHLRNMVEKINARTVVAVHSRNPEKLDPVNSIQFFPTEGCEYILQDGILIKAD